MEEQLAPSPPPQQPSLGRSMRISSQAASQAAMAAAGRRSRRGGHKEKEEEAHQQQQQQQEAPPQQQATTRKRRHIAVVDSDGEEEEEAHQMEQQQQEGVEEAEEEEASRRRETPSTSWHPLRPPSGPVGWLEGRLTAQGPAADDPLTHAVIVQNFKQHVPPPRRQPGRHFLPTPVEALRMPASPAPSAASPSLVSAQTFSRLLSCRLLVSSGLRACSIASRYSLRRFNLCPV